MKTKTKIGLIGALLMMALFLTGSPSLAEESGDQGTLVSGINIYDAQVLSQEGNIFRLTFDISNGHQVGAQSGIRYSIQLMKGSELVDEKIFEEKLTLGADEKVRKEAGYLAPEYLSGTYRLFVSVTNESGMLLGKGPLGEIKLEGTGKYVKIDPASCALKINGQADPKKIDKSGAFLEKGENLSVSCQAENKTGKSVSAIPVLAVSSGSLSADLLSEEKGAPIQLKAGEKKSISFEIKPEQKAGNYFFSFFLTDGNGKAASNKFRSSYRQAGPVATILNLTSDKTVYRKGEVAKVFAYWSGFSDGSLASEMSIIGSDGTMCAKKISNQHEKTFGGQERFEVPLEKDCSGGQIVLAIKNEKSETLDEGMIGLGKYASVQAAPQKGLSRFAVYTIFFGIITLLLVTLVFFKFRSKAGPTLVVLGLVMAGSVLFGAGKASAAETCKTRPDPGNNAYYNYTVCFNYSLNKSTYVSGETMNVSVDLSWTPHVWGVAGPDVLWAEITIGGVTKKIYESGSVSFTAPSSLGSYSAYFTFYAEDYGEEDLGIGGWNSRMNGTSSYSVGETSSGGGGGGSTASCGDGICNGSENCASCAIDCRICPYCGDGICDAVEMSLGGCAICSSDCGACQPVCGDGICNGSEVCSTCPGDCGTCPPSVCVPSGSNNYDCRKSDPICTQENCDRQATGSVSCSYSNNCGTFPGTISNGMCGNKACVADTIQCDCEKWREVEP